jgi:hypothetical protein
VHFIDVESALEAGGSALNIGCAESRKILLIVSLMGALAPGCAEREPYERQPNLRAIAAYYSQYRAHNRGQVPADEKDFKNFIKQQGGVALDHKGITVDDLFVSNRDGKPFVVKYRGDKSWPLPEAVAYEQEGSGGTRHVATIVGEYDEISEAEFRQKADTVAAKQ